MEDQVSSQVVFIKQKLQPSLKHQYLLDLLLVLIDLVIRGPFLYCSDKRKVLFKVLKGVHTRIMLLFVWYLMSTKNCGWIPITSLFPFKCKSRLNFDVWWTGNWTHNWLLGLFPNVCPHRPAFPISPKALRCPTVKTISGWGPFHKRFTTLCTLYISLRCCWLCFRESTQNSKSCNV